MKQYSTKITDKQWQFIEKIINPQGRKRKNSLRGIIDAIFYTLKLVVNVSKLPFTRLL